MTIGGAAKKLTNLVGHVTDPAWDPDDMQLAILFAEHTSGGGGPLEAEPVETGLIGGEIHNQRLALVGARSGVTWMIPYFGASVYDAPEVYAKSAPITFVKRVKTPTLIVVGERDSECPAPQSYELWQVHYRV